MAMKIDASPARAQAILAAMKAIAGGELSQADRACIVAAGLYLFGLKEPPELAHLPEMTPQRLVDALRGSTLGNDACRCLTVMALVDGRLDTVKIERVVAFAEALHIHPDYVGELAQAASGDLQGALAHMVRDNMESVTGKPWAGGDMLAWMLPYRQQPDAPLAARFRALEALPQNSFGRAWIEHFNRNGYPVPGEADALNAVFSVPHDSTHVISGYDTSPRGEILTSTFTAGMHPNHPISGHVLPVIFSWHLGVEINAVAMSAQGQLDPEEIWRAWARGSQAKVDVFAPGWDFWAWAPRELDGLRREYYS
jgi:hypothetical protein